MCPEHPSPEAQRVSVVAAIATALATAPWVSAAPFPEEMGQRAVLLGPPRAGASGWASREGTAASPPSKLSRSCLRKLVPGPNKGPSGVGWLPEGATRIPSSAICQQGCQRLPFQKIKEGHCFPHVEGWFAGSLLLDGLSRAEVGSRRFGSPLAQGDQAAASPHPLGAHQEAGFSRGRKQRDLPSCFPETGDFREGAQPSARVAFWQEEEEEEEGGSAPLQDREERGKSTSLPRPSFLCPLPHSLLRRPPPCPGLRLGSSFS